MVNKSIFSSRLEIVDFFVKSLQFKQILLVYDPCLLEERHIFNIGWFDDLKEDEKEQTAHCTSTNIEFGFLYWQKDSK